MSELDNMHREALVLRDVEGRDPTELQFTVLQTIASLTGEYGCPPSISALSRAMEWSRQRVFNIVIALRKQGLLDMPHYRGAPCVLSHNGKLLLETALGAGIKE